MIHGLVHYFAVTDSSRVNLNDLRRQLTNRLALVLIATGGLFAWLLLGATPFPLLPLLLTVGLVALGLLILSLNTRVPRLARYLLANGATAFVLIAMWVFPEPWAPFIGLGLVVINATLVTGGELATTCAIGLFSVWLADSGLRPYPVTGLLVALALTVVLARLAVSTLYTALGWAWDMQQRANELLGESQDRQASLSSTLKSLELATYQLERANHSLFIARRQADEARRMKEQFAANVSHELRTPLNLIMGFSEMMYRSPHVYGDVRWTDPLRGDVYQVYRSSRHLLDLIDDILDLSRFEMVGFTLKKEPTNLASLLRGAVDIATDLFRDHPVQLDLQVEPGLPTVEVDRTRIRQVVLNLLSNAQKFTERGTVRVTAHHAGAEVVVCISDTGSGIPAEKLSHIFEEFYQIDGTLRRSHSGAGLGLAISKNFVQAHEGRIWVESQVGIGSTFSFSLPVPDTIAPLAGQQSTAELEPPWQEVPRVLVIDPDPAVASLVRRHSPGYEVIQVRDMSLVQAEIQMHQPLIILNNVLPTESGKAVVCAPSAACVPVFECSLPSQAWLAGSLAVRASLTKPFTADQLVQQVHALGNANDVLVVDDDPGIGQLVERILSAIRSDIRVRHAHDGAAGLQAMRLHRPDLLLLDLIMPGMDGFEVLAHMQRDPALSTIPVVLCSVGSSAEDRLILKGGRIVVDQPGGLRPIEVLECFHAVAGILRASYNGGLSASGSSEQETTQPASMPMPS